MRLAKRYDLWVITESKQYQYDIENFLSEHNWFSKYITFTFIPGGKHNEEKQRPILPIRSNLRYRQWLRKAFVVTRGLHKNVHFDLIHHLRGNSFREPGYSWKLPIPFIWGPTGGTTCIPWRLMKLLSIRNRLRYILKNIITALQFRLSFHVRNASKKAAIILAETSFDQEMFFKVYGIKAMLVHEQAADPSMNILHHYDGVRELQIAWVGRCVPLKGLPILLRAISNPFLRGRVQLHIAGDGESRARWQTMAGRLGIADSCIWHGWRPQEKTIKILKKCDVLAFTSLAEATSATVMEALSVGLPIICLKHCGFGDVIDESCGITIELSDVNSVIKAFSSAFRFLIENPDMISRLSEGACAKSKEYSWDNLANKLNIAYEMATQLT
jgi:glycosyltransferase involved in cell wall biosynthesis